MTPTDHDPSVLDYDHPSLALVRERAAREAREESAERIRRLENWIAGAMHWYSCDGEPCMCGLDALIASDTDGPPGEAAAQAEP